MTEQELRRANDAFRQRDSCEAAGFLLSVKTKELDNKNKALTDSVEVKNTRILKLDKKLSTGKKIVSVSVLGNIILLLIILL